MKSLLNISTLLLLTTISVFSQSVFKNGFIIQHNNDTVFGLIEYKGNKANSKSITFKKDAESKSQQFTPGDIKAYRFDESKFYVAKVVTLAGKQELIFMEFLINGRIDMYYYFDGQNERYFVDGGDNQLVELKEGSTVINENKKRLILESKQHIGVLKYMFRESPTISKQVETINLDRKSLIDITHAYHNEVCANEECIIYEKKAPHENVRFGVMVGLSAVTVSEADEISYKYMYFRNSDFGLSLCPSFGFFAKVNIPAISAHLFFQYQGTVSHMNLSTTNSYIGGGSDMEFVNEISINQSYLGNKGIFSYEFLEGGKIHPSVHVGGFFNFSYLFSYSRHYEIYLASGDLYGEGEGAGEYDPFSSVDFGPVAGFGVVVDMNNKKAILIDLQYQKGFGQCEYFRFNWFSLNIGYQF